MGETSPPTTGRTLSVHVALVLGIFLAALAGLRVFSSSFVDVPRAQEWLGKSLPFLNTGVRDFLVRDAWQLLLAGFVAAKAVAPLKPVAAWIADSWIHEFPPFLTRVRRREDWLDSAVQQLALAGRTQELRELNGFLTGNSNLSWWWLHGAGGSGKSRLAFEWMHALRPPLIPLSSSGYDAGLFEDRIGAQGWTKLKWTPRRPTVILVDDAAERIASIVELMEFLGRRSQAFRHPVRVLLVERSVPEELTRLHTSTHLYNRCYKLDPLKASPLGAEHVRALARSLGERLGRTPDLSDRAVEQVLYVSDGLPLFVVLALQVLASHGEIQFEARDELLKREVLRLRGKIQQHGIDEGYLPLLALATFVRGVSWQAADTYLEERPRPKKTVLDRLFHEDSARTIPPIQPDILGEYFLLEEFNGLIESERQRFLSTAWQISASSVASMLVKLTMDFPSHPSLAELDRQPVDQNHAVWWGRVRVRLIGTAKFSPQEIAQYLQHLQALVSVYHAAPEFSNVLAQGMANANRSYRAGAMWNESLQSFRDLVDFAKAHQDDVQVQITLAQAAADVLEFLGRGQHKQEIRAALQAQTNLSQLANVRQSADFQLTLAVSTARSMTAGNWEDHKVSFRYLGDLARQFPEHAAIQRIAGQAAIAALAQWYEDELESDPWFGTRGKIDPQHLRGVGLSALETLRWVVDRDTSDSTNLQSDILIWVTTVVGFPIYDWERYELSLAILETLAKRHPEDLNIQLAFVSGAVEVLSRCVHFAKQVEKAGEMRDIVQRMSDGVPARLHGHEKISRYFTAAQGYVSTAAE